MNCVSVSVRIPMCSHRELYGKELKTDSAFIVFDKFSFLLSEICSFSECYDAIIHCEKPINYVVDLCVGWILFDKNL